MKLIPQRWSVFLTGPFHIKQNIFINFLGLVCYIAVFFPALAEYTSVLTLLEKKELNAHLPYWLEEHQKMFDAIKALVVEQDYLMIVEHKNPGDNKTFVMCNMSSRRMKMVLSFELTWETTCSIAFDSQQLMLTKKNYLMYEHKILAIICVL